MAYKNKKKNKLHNMLMKYSGGLISKKHERERLREEIKHPVKPLDQAECERLLRQQGLI